MRSRSCRLLSFVLALAPLALLLPTPALAGGYEYSAAGARALGRGGAFVARADDPTALLYNPAALVWLPDSEFGFDFQAGFLDACADRSGQWFQADTPGDDDGEQVTQFGDMSTWTLERIPRVCNEGPLSPGGSSIVYVWRGMPELAIGVGVLSPAAFGHTQWGNLDGTIDVEGGTRPNPLRYDLVMERNLAAYPTIGAAYRVMPNLSVGATFQWGVGSYEFVNYAAQVDGEEPVNAVRSRLLVTDWFLPRASAAVHWMPMDSVDLAAMFLWAQTVHAKGKIELTAEDYTGEPMFNRIEGVSLDAPQMSWASLGIRYADRIVPRMSDPGAAARLSGRIEDAMTTERWDVELDAVYQLNSVVKSFDVNIPAGATIATSLNPAMPVPDEVIIPHQWKNQLVLRAGGDYNLMPGFLTVRAGASFETAGFDDGYANVDFMPGQRVGAHAGLTLRFGRYDINASYVHVFQSTVQTTKDEAALPQQTAVPAREPRMINAGTYDMSVNAVAIGFDWHI